MDEIPRTRRSFVHAWDEIDYLEHKAAYWLHVRHSRSRAKRFVERLRAMIEATDPNHEVILGAQVRALIADYDGDLEGEIRHTSYEVNLLRRLCEIDVDRRGGRVDWTNVRDAMQLLALLYSENGQNDMAMKTLRSCQRLCKPRGIPFDARNLKRRIYE